MVLPNAPVILRIYKYPFIWFSEHGKLQFPFKINNLTFPFKFNDLTWFNQIAGGRINYFLFKRRFI